MACGWVLGNDDQWAATLLDGNAWCLGNSEDWLHSTRDPVAADVLLLPATIGRTERWLLLINRVRRVTVNGVPLHLGLCELRDRDEVLVAEPAGKSATGSPPRFYFSNERLACVESLPNGSRPVYCVRCKQLIEVGTPAVRCPSQACGLWHHQTNELPCWEYAKCCAACDQLTDLNAGFRWTPAEL